MTGTQRAWAEAQVGQERTSAVSGIVTKVAGRRGEYVLTVEGDDGAATFEANTTAEVARAHKGVESQVLLDGVVTSIVYEDEAGRVGLVIEADNGRVTEWHVPAGMEP